MTAPTEVRWGVLSTANIGRKAVAPAIRASRNGRLVAVASRSDAAARAYAAELDIPRHHGSYEALLADPDVDAVYIPLPNSLHLTWAVRAAEAGKHVLCEKPLALSARDCLAIDAAARHSGVRLMEAFMYRFHPRTEAVRARVHAGDLGRLTLVRSAFTFALRRRDDIRLSAELGGGALHDVGCYCVDVSRALFDREPTTVQGFARLGESGVDEELVATLRFDDAAGGGADAFAQFHCALTLPRQEFYEAVGPGGRLEVQRAFLPGPSETEAVHHPAGAEPAPQRFDGVDQYRLMVEHFADCVLNGEQPRYGAREAAATMRVIEALHRSVRSGGQPADVAR